MPAARRLASWAPALLYAALIFGLSSISQPPALPGGVSDKFVHGCLYAGFGLLVVRATAGGRWEGMTRRAALVALVLAAAYGASDELHQRFVPGRTCDVLDWVADVAGAAGGIGIGFAAARLRSPS